MFFVPYSKLETTTLQGIGFLIHIVFTVWNERRLCIPPFGFRLAVFISFVLSSPFSIPSFSPSLLRLTVFISFRLSISSYTLSSPSSIPSFSPFLLRLTVFIKIGEVEPKILIGHAPGEPYVGGR
uniref:Uncharacterized protein n=1 Tax=Cacopsylla melanoneura TaxID=428564 RepID=A0A8D9B9Q8_9HEMI